MTECLNFFVDIPQCKHIIFGACHDSGYAPFLGKFAADASIRDRITLLHGTSSRPHPSIAILGFGKLLRLDTVFAPNSPLAVTTPPPSIPIHPHRSPTRKASSETSSSRLASSTQLFNPRPMSERLGPVMITNHGEGLERVDRFLDIDVSSSYLNVVRQRKLCHGFYLRGKCDGKCQKSHVAPPLNAREFDYLWYLARGGLCYQKRKGKVCDDKLCVYGHEEGRQVGTGRVEAYFSWSSKIST